MTAKEVFRRVLRALIPLGVVGVGVLIYVAFVQTAPTPKRTKTPSRGVLVEVETVDARSHRVVVEAQGTVMAAQAVDLVPEVAGKVVWVSDRLVPGGRVREGEPLLRVDSRDYRIAVRQRSADVSAAELALEQEQSRKRVAAREWQLLEDDVSQVDEAGRLLALRQPFVENAEVAVDAAESALQKARLDLSRTTLRAPFDALIQSETVERGQVVGPNAPVASLVGTNVFWVQASVPVDALPWLRFADDGTAGGDGGGDDDADAGLRDEVRGGSFARVVQEAGRARQEREARVLRLLGDLDPVGRMARVIVEVPNPLGGPPPPASTGGAETEGDPDGSAPTPGLPLLVGSYVTVEMEGPAVDDVIEVPRVALREGQTVFVMTDENTLDIRDVRLLWRRESSVLVDEGLRSGDRIVVSRIPSPVEGMKLRVAEAPSEDGPAGDDPEATAPRAEATR
jgi:RND family efflux transporter MFP subunit